MIDLLICSYLEPEHVDRIRRVSDTVRVHYHPELLPPPRYPADHTGGPFVRDEAEERHWRELLAVAEVCFDVDYVDLAGFTRHAERIKWIQTSSSGIGQLVARTGLDRLGAVLTTAAGVHAVPLAEFVVWSMLTFAKEYPRARRQQEARVWERFHTEDLRGSTLAVVGLGSVGREVARLATALGVRVVGTKRDPTGADPASLNVQEVVPMADLHRLLAVADYVCLVAPHTPETEAMIGPEEFAVMKPGSVLVNIGRGALVQEEALLSALRTGPLRGAVLDVAPHEPLPSEHPLWAMDNVIVYPHSASTSSGENQRLTDLFVDNLQRYLDGRPLRNVFDAGRLY
jgi:phosphoglycerate dehydrogenase-like enzyme